MHGIPLVQSVEQTLQVNGSIHILLRVSTEGVGDAPAFKLGGMHAITQR
jgi:hypothetical protein